MLPDPLDELSQAGLTTSILLPMPMHNVCIATQAILLSVWGRGSHAHWHHDLYCMMVHLVVMWKVHITYYLAVTVAQQLS